MKRNFSVSRRQWAALLFGAMLLGGLLFVRTRGLPDAVRPDAEWDALRAEHIRLSATTPDVLTSLRRELALLERPHTAGPGAVPVGWKVEADPADAAHDGSLRYRYTGSTALTWAELGRFVTELEQRSGGRVIVLDIRSRGSRERRQIAGVEIIVAGAPETTRRKAGATLPGAAEPARPRKVGRGPSLRRPSACADRPAARLRLPARPPLRPSPTLRGMAGHASISSRINHSIPPNQP
ncbi:MAG: hypothetical protein Q8N18_07060 [Opitutaceae bacterium]|nr:hypothetical protein [Opitutaceae bacterium]